MKRHRVIKDFLSYCVKENDIVIFSGEELSKEAFLYDRPGNFYICSDSYGISPSLALGMAMHTDKRVFVLCGDGDFLMEFSSAAQMAVSKCKNLFYMVLDNGCYQSAGNHPTIFGELLSIKGIAFNLGFIVYDFSSFFKNKTTKTEMSNFFNNMLGPAFILMQIDKGIKKDLKDIDHSKEELRNRIFNFVVDKESGTSLFVPPPIGNLNIGG